MGEIHGPRLPQTNRTSLTRSTSTAGDWTSTRQPLNSRKRQNKMETGEIMNVTVEIPDDMGPVAFKSRRRRVDCPLVVGCLNSPNRTRQPRLKNPLQNEPSPTCVQKDGGWRIIWTDRRRSDWHNPIADRRRTQLRNWLDNDLVTFFAGRLLPVTQVIADRWGVLSGRQKTIRSIGSKTAPSHGRGSERASEPRP